MADVTIRDIAREAGVAVSTVSYALSGKVVLRKETRRRIIEAAERLGYRPRPARRRSGTRSETPLIVILVELVIRESCGVRTDRRPPV